MMELASKKNVKVVSLTIAAVFIVGMFVMGLQQSGLGQGNAGNPLDSAIGTVNYNELMRNVPGIAEAQSTMRQAMEADQKEFDAKSKGMNDEEKAKLLQEYKDKLQAKEKEVVTPLKKKVDDAILSVAKTKGMAVIVNKETCVYGGLDVTADVAAALKK